MCRAFGLTVADQLEITNCDLLHPNRTSFDSLIVCVMMMNSVENWNSMDLISCARPVLLSLFFPFPNVLVQLVQLVLPDVVFWSLRLLELPSPCALSLPSCATLPCLRQ